MWFRHGLKAQKPLAQGIALGTPQSALRPEGAKALKIRVIPAYFSRLSTSGSAAILLWRCSMVILSGILFIYKDIFLLI